VTKARAWLALSLISFGTLAATVSCGSDEVTGGGVGGGLITGGNGGAAGKGGAVARGGSGGGTGGSSTLISTLGQACALDSDCGGGSALAAQPMAHVRCRARRMPIAPPLRRARAAFPSTERPAFASSLA
jgi:hypothetical protein